MVCSRVLRGLPEGLLTQPFPAGSMRERNAVAALTRLTRRVTSPAVLRLGNEQPLKPLARAGFFHKAPMSRRAYSEINLHFVWHVKSNLPIITAEIESGLYRFIRNYALKTKGLIFHAVGGIETHVHIAVTIPPTLLISEWIGQINGASLPLRQSRTRQS
jgi:hypothetical protein